MIVASEFSKISKVIGELNYNDAKDVFVWTDEGSGEAEIFEAAVIEQLLK